MRKVLLSLLCLSTAVVVSAQQLGTEEYKGFKKYIAAVDEYVPAPGQFINTMPKFYFQVFLPCALSQHRHKTKCQA